VLEKKAGRSRRALYVAIEGIDGSGKTTVARLLVNSLALKGYKAALVKEPYTAEIKSLLEESSGADPLLEAYLFAADRLFLHRTVLKRLLEVYDVVVSDRSFVASLVYQGARGAPEHLLRLINEPCEKPDVVYVLDVPVEVALERLGKERRRFLALFESPATLEVLRRKYLEVAKELSGLAVVVDATKPLEEVVSELLASVESMLKEFTARERLS